MLTSGRKPIYAWAVEPDLSQRLWRSPGTHRVHLCPGGNVTGVTLYGSELARKRMEVFKEAVVGTQRIVVLGNVENPLHRFIWDDLQPIGPALGLQFRLFVVSGLDKLPAVFFTMKQDGFDAVTLLSDAQFFSARRQISSLAAMYRLPAMYESRESVADGGLNLLWSEYS